MGRGEGVEGEQEDHRDGPDGDGVNLDAVRCDGVLHVVDIDAPPARW